MKKTLRFLTLGIATLIGIAAFSMPVFAQDDAAKKTEECNKIYNEQFLKNRQPNQPQAYLDAKLYMEKCTGNDADIDKYVKNWVIKYEWGKLKVDFETAVSKMEFANAYKYGKEILAKSPESMAELIQLKAATGNENVSTTIKMGYLGFEAERKKDKAYRSDAANYSKMAVQMIESGKAPDAWAPFKGKDDTLGYLYYTLGLVTQETSPKEGVGYFYKSLSFDTPVRTTPATYLFIANYYQAEYLKVTQTIKSKCENVPENDECKALDEQQAAWMDRWADALARAVNVGSKTTPPTVGVNDWKKTLNDIFKVRYNTGDDTVTSQAVNEYVGSVQSKPLPDPATEPKPEPVREVKKDAATDATKQSGAITTTTTTSDVAVGNGMTATNGTNGTATTTTGAAKTTPAKKAPAKGKKKPNR